MLCISGGDREPMLVQLKDHITPVRAILAEVLYIAGTV